MTGVVVPPPAEPVSPLAESPSFSVIVAAYQAAHVIGEALESALTQSPAPLDVVVCDDGSTDDLDAELAPFGDRVTLVRQPNRGEGAAKNSAARAACGEFVVLLDADDLFLPGRLAALGELARERPDLDILTTDAFISVDGVRLGPYYGQCAHFVTDDQQTAILRANFVFGLAAARRERLLAVGGFDEALRYTSDWSGWIRLILSGSRAGLVDEPLAVYRRHDGGLSADRVAMVQGRIENLRRASAAFPLNPRQDETVAQVIAAEERRIPVEHMRDGLRGGAPDARRRAGALVRTSGCGRSERLQAGVAWLLPGLVSRALRWAGTTSCGEPRPVSDAVRERVRRWRSSAQRR